MKNKMYLNNWFKLYLRYTLIILTQFLFMTNCCVSLQKFCSINTYNYLKYTNYFCDQNSKRFFSDHEKEHKKTSNKKTVRILSIDGGGIRGVIPLTVLEHIEKRTGRPISKLFDVISGTSTGGVIALGLSRSNSENELDTEKCKSSLIKRLYTKENSKIFYQPSIMQKFRFLSYIWNSFSSKYSSKTLEETLEEEFGHQLFSESISTIIIPSYDIKNSKIHVFNSYNSKLGKDSDGKNIEDFYAKDVAIATSAAPTYFPPVRIFSAKKTLSTEDKDKIENQVENKKYEYNSDSKYELIDGGVAANNPTLIAYSHARDLFPEANDFLILSLGTGVRTIGFTRYKDLKSGFWDWLKSGSIKGDGFIGWARKLPGLMINASSSSNEHCLDIFLKEFKHDISYTHKYFRFQPELEERLASLDSTHKEIISDLVSHGDRMVNNHPWKAMFDLVVDELKTEREYADKHSKILIPGIHLNKAGEELVDSSDVQDRIIKEVFRDPKISRKYYTKEQAQEILDSTRKKLNGNPD